MLTRRQIRFIAEYFRTDPRDQVAAYMLAYDHPEINESTQTGAYALMRRPEIRDEIKRWEFQIAKSTRLDIDDFNAEIARLAMADARDLCGYYVGACRYCYGVNYRYQRTPAEFQNDMNQHVKLQEKINDPDPFCIKFDSQGGIGFNPKKQPIEECPECHGDGVGYEVFHDTRYLTPGAARMFDGVKRTKDGLEIKLRSRDKMILAAGQALGQLRGTPTDPDADNSNNEVRVIGGLPEDNEPELIGPPRMGDVPT